MKIVLAALVALSVPLSASAQSSSSGLTGLGEMRTPEVIPDNGSQITLVGRRSQLSGNGSIENRLAPSLGYVQGWGEKLEVGVQFPLYVHEDDSGLGNIALATKVKSPRQFWKNTDLAITGGIDLPSGSRQDKYGSGTPGFGADVLGSVSVPVPVIPDVTFAGSFGYGTADYCPRCTVPGAQLRKPRSLAVVRASGGASIEFLQSFAAFGELHALKANNGDQTHGEYSGDPDLYTIVGARAAFLGRFGATVYAGIGLHEGSNTDSVGAVMLHYSFSSGLAPKGSRKP